MATATVQLEEEALVRASISAISLPKGVRLKQVKQGSEWTGEPALRIEYTVSKKVPLTKERLSELNKLRRAVQEAIFALNLEKWPFVTFLEAR